MAIIYISAMPATATVLDKAQSRQRIGEISQLWNEWDPFA